MAANIEVADREQMTVALRVWRAAALWLLGFSAIALITAVGFATMNWDALPTRARQLGPGAMVAINLGANGLLLAFAVTVGALTAHRCGLISLIAHSRDDYVRRLKSFPFYLTLGIALGLGLALLDGYLFRSIPGLAEAREAVMEHRQETIPLYKDPYTVSLITKFAYGGIVEEILLRWCVMSGIAWLILKAGVGRMAALTLAIVISAILFGVGHLPALFKILPDAPVEMVIRTVALNSIPGMVYGLAYVRNSLEAAMVMHASTHIGLLVSATAAI